MFELKSVSPVKLFISIFKSSKRVKLENVEGIVQDKLALNHKFRFVKLTKFHNSLGIVHVNELPYILRVNKLVKFHNSLGIVHVKAQKETSISVSPHQYSSFQL
jgi:hypothetical protein